MLRGHISIIAVITLFLAVVLPVSMASSAMAGSHVSTGLVSSDMPCPDCKSGMKNGNMATCGQISCIGIAVAPESSIWDGVLQRTFTRLAAPHLSEISFAPDTPPI